MSPDAERHRERWRRALTAALLAVLDQVFISWNNLTNSQGNYGAPLLVGQGGLGFGVPLPSFSFEKWIINVIITVPIFWILVELLKVHRVLGSITVVVVSVTSTVLVYSLDISNGHPDQVIFWTCGIAASAILFGIERILGLLICRVRSRSCDKEW